MFLRRNIYHTSARFINLLKKYLLYISYGLVSYKHGAGRDFMRSWHYSWGIYMRSYRTAQKCNTSRTYGRFQAFSDPGNPVWWDEKLHSGGEGWAKFWRMFIDSGSKTEEMGWKWVWLRKYVQVHSGNIRTSLENCRSGLYGWSIGHGWSWGRS